MDWCPTILGSRRRSSNDYFNRCHRTTLLLTLVPYNLGDGVSFEVRPTRDTDWSMHNYCLGGWGVPIGEMFDLERLAELCKKLNRWTFFVTSSPLNHPRAVASPPNMMALF